MIEGQVVFKIPLKTVSYLLISRRAASAKRKGKGVPGVAITGCFQGLFQNKHGLSLRFAAQSILMQLTVGRAWGAQGMSLVGSPGPGIIRDVPKMRISGEEAKGVRKSKGDFAAGNDRTRGAQRASPRGGKIILIFCIKLPSWKGNGHN